MTAPTLPGEIPALLRWCSPVRSASDPARIGVVVGTYPSGDLVVCWTWEGLTEDRKRADVVLDLSDATGCLHALWWMRSTVDGVDLCGVGSGGWDFMVRAVEAGHMMHPDMLDKFRAIMLRAAGLP